MVTPEGFENWNPAMRGAYRKGWDAGNNGDPEDSCPYRDKRQDTGKLTWSRAFMAAWHDGWVAARCEIWDVSITDYYRDRNRYNRV